jgi:hypothetical protein
VGQADVHARGRRGRAAQYLRYLEAKFGGLYTLREE